MHIQIKQGSLSGRERVTRALHREPVDRVPINYSANPTVHGRLVDALGLGGNDYETFLQMLGVDIRGTAMSYQGPSLFEPIPGREVDPVYGVVSRWVPNRDGGYWDFCDFPLQNAPPEKIASFPVPSPDDFDYDSAVAFIRRHDKNGYAAHVGNAGKCDLINSTGRVMGMEDTLVNLLQEDEATLHYIDRRCDMEIGILERLLHRAADHVAFVWMGEDLGTQNMPMISLDLYRKVFRPRHQRYIDLAKSYGKPMMVHTCGSSSWVYDDFIEMGVSAVDTLQPEAVNMSPAYLKSRYGDKLAFQGCISTAGPLAYGTPEEVRENVRETLSVMMPGGGYLLAPTHLIQDNTPVENIVAMYNAAHEFGFYK